MKLFKKKRDTATKPFKIAIWVVVGVLFVVGIISIAMVKSNIGMRSAANVSAIDTPNNTKLGYTGQASPEFNSALREAGKQQSLRAKQKGQSHVAPMDNGVQEEPADFNSILKKKVKRYEANNPVEKVQPMQVKKKEVQPRQNPRRNTQTRQNKRSSDREKAVLDAYKKQMAVIGNAMVFTPGSTTIYDIPGVETTSMAKGTDNARTDNSASETPQDSKSFNMVKTFGFMPGKTFYAANKQTINTDTPAPAATVELLSGPLKHSVAEGTFELQGEDLIFTFSKLTTKEGDRYKMTGFAVDPSTKFIGVASEVDHHTFSRWGGLIISSLASGWASAVEASGSSTSANVGSGLVVSENPDYDWVDQLIIASGEVADSFSDAAKENFKREATAWLYAQDPVGVLILDLEPI